MEQNREFRNRPIRIWTTDFCQRYRSQTNGAGIGHPDAKLKIDPYFNVCKKQLKMVYSCKYNTPNCITSKRKQRENVQPWVNYRFRYDPKSTI